MKENISSIVFNALMEPISQMGYELYDVEYMKKQNGMNLTIFIYLKDRAVALDDCERVHHAIDILLDDLNPTKDMPYYLNVSSVGLDRPLTLDKDFDRAVGKRIEVKLFSKIDGKKDFEGVLTTFNKDTITLDDSVIIDRKDIALCKFHIDF